ncbi:hypothetical protein [Streptomyces sp. NPDC007083]|uniref:hypothetical protein n=1 Tax=Streptomyces sp. NPDC007083 TaxID=3156913 RepID=UPI0033EFBF4B
MRDVTHSASGRHARNAARTTKEPPTEPPGTKNTSEPGGSEGDSLTGPLALDGTGNSAPQADYDLEAFGAFWLAYPRKRNREDARTEWLAAIDRGANPAHIVQAATDYARERATEDPRYTPYPATWLRRGAYDDEPEPQPVPRGRHLRAVGDWQQQTDDLFDRAMARARARDAQGGTP